MEPAASLPFAEAMANLASHDELLSISKLAHLSAPDSAEMALFAPAWAKIEVERRRQVLSRLVELTEDNLELDFDRIFRHCLRDEDAEVRSKAIEGLWENEETSLIAPLLNLLEQDSTEEVRAAAAAALGKFTMLAELGKLRSDHKASISRALLAIINDKSKPLEVRRRALEAIAPLSIPEVATAINKAYHSDNYRLRASAVYAMGRNSGPYWLPLLLKELDSPEEEIRYEAAGACGELREEEATPCLIRLTDDPDTGVQLAAIRALGMVGGKEAREHLQQCLNHPSEPARDAAEQALEELEAEANLASWRIT